MAGIEFLSRATDQVVDHYVDITSRSRRMISTTQAIRAIRAALPNCRLSDRELADLVAAAAIRKGSDVAFDA